MPALENRLERLERNSCNDVALVIISKYINPDGTPTSVDGYSLLSGEQIQRFTTESAEACEVRAIERALQVAGGASIHSEAIIHEQT